MACSVTCCCCTRNVTLFRGPTEGLRCAGGLSVREFACATFSLRCDGEGGK